MPRATPRPPHEPVCEEHHHASPVDQPPLSVTEAQRMGEFFAVLADPTRLRLIALLEKQEHCVCDIAAHLSTTESAVSHQLRALRAARLVTYRKEGRQVFYQLHDHHVLDLYRNVREHLAE